MPTKKTATTKKALAKKRSVKKTAAKKTTASKKTTKKKTTATKKTARKKVVAKKADFAKKKLPVQAQKKVIAPIEEAEEIEGVVREEETVGIVEETPVDIPQQEDASAQEELTPETAPIERGIGDGDDSHIDQELTQIYENGDGSMPDMSQFDTHRRHRIFRAFITLLLSLGVLAGVAYVGFFVYQPQGQFSESDVIFSISGDEEIISGEEVRYRIRYRNAQRVPLARASLQVRYPEGFVFEGASVDATNDTNTQWDIGTLEPGDGDSIDVWGRLYGSLGERQSLRAFLNYTPANFSSAFQKVESLASEVTTATVALGLELPEQIPVGAETQLTFSLAPKEGPTGPFVVVLTPPSDFVLKSSEPVVDENEQYQWSFESIEEAQSLRITGTFESGETATIGATVYQWKDDARQDDGYVVGQVSKEVALVSTDLTANLVINGTLDDFTVQPGETLSASIVIKNIGDTPLERVAATLVFDAPSLDNSSLLQWIELEDAADGAIVGEQRSQDIRRGSITWNRYQVPDFTSLEPGEEIVLDVSLPLKTIDDMELSLLKTFEITSMVDVQFDKDGERDIFSSNQLVMTVNSDVALDVQHDVIEDTHTVRWIVTNSFHELESLVLEADLFGDITWNADALVVPAGDVVYDEEGQTLVWTVDQMPTSVDVLALQFAFDTGVIDPSQTNLTSKIRFTAVDAITGQTITIVGDEILTVASIE